MKPFNKKLLVLSLSALVLVGSGCERRGRAPIQKKTDQGGVANVKEEDVAVDNSLSPEKEEKTHESEPRVVSDKEAELIKDSAMSCKMDINEKEAPSKETFEKDFASIRNFFMCLGLNAGIPFTHTEDANAPWTISVETDEDGRKTLKKEFEKLAMADKSNEEDAEWILGSRLALFRIYANQMLTKYSPEKIDQNLQISVTSTSKLKHLGSVNADLKAMIAATVVADEVVKKLAIVKDGELQTERDGDAADIETDEEKEVKAELLSE